MCVQDGRGAAEPRDRAHAGALGNGARLLVGLLTSFGSPLLVSVCLEMLVARLCWPVGWSVGQLVGWPVYCVQSGRLRRVSSEPVKN